MLATLLKSSGLTWACKCEVEDEIAGGNASVNEFLFEDGETTDSRARLFRGVIV